MESIFGRGEKFVTHITSITSFKDLHKKRLVPIRIEAVS